VRGDDPEAPTESERAAPLGRHVPVLAASAWVMLAPGVSDPASTPVRSHGRHREDSRSRRVRGGPPTAWCWCAPPWGRLAWAAATYPRGHGTGRLPAIACSAV